MRSYFFRHLIQYLLLAGIILLGITVALAAPGYPTRLLAAVGLPLLYFGWGVLHHLLEHRLSLPTVLEYLAISLILLVVLLNLTS